MTRRGLELLDVDALMRLVDDGDSEALGEIQARYVRFVRSVVRRYVADPGAAEEVVQDVFTDLWRRPGRFDPSRATFGAWLAIVAKYTAIDRFRVERGPVRRRTVLLPDQDSDDGPADGLNRLARPSPGADAAALEAVIGGIVRAAVQRLPPVQREAVLLHYYAGYSMPEVAAMLDVPVPTVKTRVRDARKRLRRFLFRLREDRR